jgi:hypothetical protein
MDGHVHGDAHFDGSAGTVAMGDGTEPVPLLDSTTIQRLQRRVMETANRKELDTLTRHIWRSYDDPKNEAGLKQLRAAIEARRAMVGRGNGR